MRRRARPFKRRRMGMRRRVRGRIGRRGVHHFKRGSALNTINGNAVYAPYVDSLSFNLNAVINPSDFTSLYDQYRINYVVVKFHLRIDPSAQAAGSASYPRLYYYRDLDDTTAPSNLNEMRENQRCRMKVLNPQRCVTIKIRPNVLGMLYSTVGVTQYTPKFKQWLDCSTSTTIHYGIKYAIDDLTNTNYKVDIEKWYYISCRNSR